MHAFTILAFALVFAQAAPTATPPPAPPAAPATRPLSGASGTLSLDVSFIEPSGSTLAERHTRIALGTTETISVQQGNRTVSLEATVRPGAKAGCHKIDVTLRDRRIDPTGRFNKTVWQSASEPCGSAPIVLGPKEETRVQVALKPPG